MIIKSKIGFFFNCAVVAFVLILFSVPVAAQEKPDSLIPPPSMEYTLALAKANLFLFSWEKSDRRGGVDLCSERLRLTESEADLMDQIGGLPNPHHTAFEVYAGTKLPDGRYSFPVSLYNSSTGDPYSVIVRKSVLILVQSEEQGWAVDELP